MDTLREDKGTPDSAHSLVAQSDNVSPPPKPVPDTHSEKSWGDKYKAKTFGFTRNVIINFAINAAIAALGTYAVIKSPANKILQKGVDGIATNAVAIGLHPELGKFLGEFLVRTQLLLCAGHLLVPPLKAMHDNRKHLEFSIGHGIDRLQQSLGHANDATRRNLKEYRHVQMLLATKPDTLSAQDKQLLKKHHINENFEFDEKRETWKHVLIARVLGVASTTSLSAVFAMGSYYGGPKKLNQPWMNVKETYLKRVGAEYGEKWLGRSLNKIGIHDSRTMGELIVLELLYTFASKLGFDYMENRLLEKQGHKEVKECHSTIAPQHDMPEQDKQESRLASASPTLEMRRKIVDTAHKDFRSREMIKPSESQMMLS